jgi:hypothetical protein
MQKLGVHKLLIFYSLDYPTNVTPNFNNNKNTLKTQCFVFFKNIQENILLVND